RWLQARRCLDRDGDDVPAHPSAVLGHLHGGEDVRAERLIGVIDHDRHVEQRHEALANENPLFLAADEHRDLAAALDRLLECLRRRWLRRIRDRRRFDDVAAAARGLVPARLGYSRSGIRPRRAHLPSRAIKRPLPPRLLWPGLAPSLRSRRYRDARLSPEPRLPARCYVRRCR